MQCSFTYVPFMLHQYLLPILCSALVINVLFDYDKKGEIYNCIIKGEKRFYKNMELTLNERMKNIIKGEFISNALN